MSYLVLARKYRPETFRDVVGQESVSKTLRNSIEHGRIAHAFLFSGPRGVGKTSMARILSKALNCEKGPASDPCLECEQCRTISAGSAIDVIEIDAASNRGIDNVRSLRENVRYAPAGGRFKIYIIDEVHMLTTESFNALLKTLEEPPEHVKFIFATTEPQKLPETVRSRCQCFEFRRISTDDIAARLETIMEKEKIPFEKGLLHRIAAYSRGGMRDAQSLLDQIIAFGGNSATFEGLSELTGSLSPEAMGELVDAILEDELAKVLDLADGFFKAGTRAEDLFRELVDHFRLLMIVLAGAGTVDLHSTGVGGDVLEKQAAKTNLDRIMINMQIALQTLRQSRLFDDERVLAEVALIRMTRVSSSMDLAEALSLLRESGGAAAASGPRGRPASAGAPPRSRRQGTAPGSGPAASRKRRSPDGNEGPSPAPAANFPSSIPASGKKQLERLYETILGEVEKSSRSTAVTLRGFRPQSLSNDLLLLRDEGDGGKRLLGPHDPTVANLLRDASQRTLGRALVFKVEAQSKQASPGNVPPIVEKTRQMFEGDIV
jgi:DNA polymerase-3 subunit gamma/tau